MYCAILDRTKNWTISRFRGENTIKVFNRYILLSRIQGWKIWKILWLQCTPCLYLRIRQRHRWLWVGQGIMKTTGEGGEEWRDTVLPVPAVCTQVTDAIAVTAAGRHTHCRLPAATLWHRFPGSHPCCPVHSPCLPRYAIGWGLHLPWQRLPWGVPFCFTPNPPDILLAKGLCLLAPMPISARAKICKPAGWFWHPL